MKALLTTLVMPHKLNNISRQDTRYAALMTNVKLFSHLFFAFNIAFGVRRQQILGLLNYFILLILIGQCGTDKSPPDFN